jgi:hypothetical protein
MRPGQRLAHDLDAGLLVVVLGADALNEPLGREVGWDRGYRRQYNAPASWRKVRL